MIQFLFSTFGQLQDVPLELKRDRQNLLGRTIFWVFWSRSTRKEGISFEALESSLRQTCRFNSRTPLPVSFVYFSFAEMDRAAGRHFLGFDFFFPPATPKIFPQSNARREERKEQGMWYGVVWCGDRCEI
jgi:hypothetical protein